MHSGALLAAIALLATGFAAPLVPAPASAAKADRDWAICSNKNSSDDDSIATCTRVLQRRAGLSDKQRATALNNRGISYKNKGEFDRALPDLNEAIRLNPKDGLFFNNRGGAYFGKNDFDAVIRDLDEAIRLGVRNAAVYDGRGTALLHKRAYDRALRDFDAALRVDPRYVEAQVGRGMVFVQRGELDRGLQAFDAALRLAPRSAAAYANRGDIYRRKGDLDRALADLNESIRLDADRMPSLVSRALTYEARGERERAVADFQRALSMPWSSYVAGQWAYDTARERLAALTAPVAPAAPAVQAASPTPHAAPAQPGRRVALVIGNGAYPGRARLANPANDADDVAAALMKVGFDVVKGTDLSLAGFGQMIASFRDKAVGAEVALFYYAGHGMQFDDQNWLLPVDATAKTLFEARRQFIPVSEAIAEVEARAAATLVFLDSCRDNPLEETLKAGFRAQGRGYADTRGLTRPDIKSQQTMIVFATRPNTIAADGEGRNSPFTEAFLQHVGTPGVEIEALMKRVSASVASKTKGKQQPERLSRLEAEFYFVPVR
jgi:tetratricopeptide (TPR) repeat protein